MHRMDWQTERDMLFRMPTLTGYPVNGSKMYCKL